MEAPTHPIKSVLTWVKNDLSQPLPKHVNWLFTLGTVALFLFVVQLISGVLLMIYYKPNAKSAYDSVEFIMNEVRFGWLIRQVHIWGANLMVFVVFLHMLRVFFYGSYKTPREATWMTGVLILISVLGFGLTGYLLPWSQLSYWATTVTTEVAGYVPVIGAYILKVMRGGESVSDYTLGRFFAMHVVVLPAILTFLILTHLFLVRLFSIAPLERTDKPKPTAGQIAKEGGKPFFPNHLLKEGIVAYIVFGILLSLAILVPFELPERANPLLTPEGIKPEWYFLAMYQSIKYVPKVVGILGSMALLFILFLLPLIDRSKERRPKRRPVAISLGIASILVVLIFSVLGHLAESTHTIFGTKYHFDIKSIPHKEEQLSKTPEIPSAKSGQERVNP